MSRAAAALLVPLSAALAVATLSVAVTAQTGERRRPDPVWYTPNPGSLDLRRMFEEPDEWQVARRFVSVFQFTQQHTYRIAPAIVGPNGYEALVRSGAFRRLVEWRIKTAIGVGAVKEFYCTPDESGMNTAIRDALDAISAVRAGGGAVHYLSMDEPFLSGQLPRCGGPELEPTADRLARYMTAVQQAYRGVRIGLIEAYPSFGPDAFGRMLQLMRARDVLPAFLHLDIDLWAVRNERRDFAGDLRRIQGICAAEGIPFGVIIWGHDGDSDALFARDAHDLALAVQSAYTSWDEMPDRFIFESWSESSTGLRITPSNLPDTRRYTLTNLLIHTYRRFLAGSGPSAGTAIPRRE